jgi:hypothetical protein
MSLIDFWHRTGGDRRGLESAPVDEWVSLPRGYRAIKLSRERGATYFDEVRIDGTKFDHRNHIAVGIAHAAKRIARRRDRRARDPLR